MKRLLLLLLCSSILFLGIIVNKANEYQVYKTYPQLEELTPAMAEKTANFIAKAKNEGYQIVIVQGYRTAAQQNACFAQGRVNNGSIITNAKGDNFESKHQWGEAIDIIYTKNGKRFPPDERLGQIGEECGLTWLGRCKNLGFADPYHFQNN